MDLVEMDVLFSKRFLDLSMGMVKAEIEWANKWTCCSHLAPTIGHMHVEQ